MPSPRPRQHVRYVPYSGLSAVPHWVSRPPERRRICLTWGTSTTRIDARYTSWLPDVLAGLCEVDADVVLAVTARDRRLLGRLPDRVRVAESVPLAALLPGCAAVVHQGGAGTTLTAVSCGVPQLVIAQIADQVVTAGRVAPSGVARCLFPAADPVAGSAGLAGRVRDEVSALLDGPAYRAAAAAVRAESLAQPTPQSIVPVLDRLVRVQRPGGAR